MPFVNITIYEAHPKNRNEVTPPDRYVAGNPGTK